MSPETAPMPTHATETLTAAGGACVVTLETGPIAPGYHAREREKQRAKIRADLPKITGRRSWRSVTGFGAPRPVYRDPAKPRTVEQVRADYTAIDVKGLNTDRAHAAIGRPMIEPGWRLIQTNGEYAIGIPGPTEGDALWPGAITWYGEIHAEDWRHYLPVAACRGRDGRVTWTLSTGRLSWHAAEGWGLVEGRSWIAMPSPEDAPIVWAVDQRYVTPLYGRTWRVGRMPATPYLLLETAGEGEGGPLRVLLAGMRVEADPAPGEPDPTEPY